MNDHVEESGLRCLECDYNLTGLSGSRCPECGWEIDEDLLGQLESAPSPDGQRSLTALLSVFAGVLLVGGYFAILLFSRGISNPNFAGLDQAARLMLFFCGAWHLGIALLCMTHRRTWPVVAPGMAWLCRITGIAAMVGALGLVLGTASASAGVVDSLLKLAFGWLPGGTLLVASGVALTTKRASVRQLRSRVARQRPTASVGAPFCVEIAGRFTAAGLVVDGLAIRRRRHAVIEALIEETWKRETGRAEASGRRLYDAPVGRLRDATVTNGRMHLSLEDTTYREFVGTNLYNAATVSQFSGGMLADALGTSAVAITADGRIVMGRRSERVSFHQGHLHTFGGLLEERDRLSDGRYDVYAGIRREIREELGIGAGAISDLVCVGLVRDASIQQPELLFDASLAVTSVELKRRFEAAGDEEHVRLEACDDLPDAVVPFIQRSGPMTPVAMAALLLHGKCNWGADWYEGACYVLFGALPEAVR
ncbi:MAG: hypothetical protein HOP29_01135 [Phycisphaerales bacterium]|nr:hypothetical protein [Phycisphaerales bacterium]